MLHPKLFLTIDYNFYRPQDNSKILGFIYGNGSYSCMTRKQQIGAWLLLSLLLAIALYRWFNLPQ